MKAKPEYEVVYQELVDLLKRHADKMSALEVLAVAANVVGKLLALQDQRSVTTEKAMYVIMRNIESGNRQLIEELAAKTAGEA